MPLVQKVRQKAALTICENNLRAIGGASATYASQEGGRLFPDGNDFDLITVSWPYIFFGNAFSSETVCPSGQGREVFSYMMNHWLTRRKKRLGSRLNGLSPGDAVLCGEHVVGINVLYSEDLNAVLIDHQRHFRKSPLLWMDFHVDCEEPPHPWDASDPWSISD
jgi:hypothetical protein